MSSSGKRTFDLSASLCIGSAPAVALVTATHRYFTLPVLALTPVNVAAQGFTYDPATGFFDIVADGLYAMTAAVRLNPDALVPVGSFAVIGMADVANLPPTFDAVEFAMGSPPSVLQASNSRAHGFSSTRRLHAGLRFRFSVRAWFAAGAVTSDTAAARLTRVG